jgi:histone H2A
MSRRRCRRRQTLTGRLQRGCKKVLKQVHPKMTTEKGAKSAICQAVYWCAENVVSTAFTHLRCGKATVTARELQSAIRLLFPTELAKFAIAEGTKAVMRFQASRSAPFVLKTALTTQAGLLVPPSLLRPLLSCRFKRVAKPSTVFLAALVQYLMAEILELSGNTAKNQKKKKSRISPRHVFLAATSDEELGTLFKRAVFVAGGVMPTLIIMH